VCAHIENEWARQFKAHAFAVGQAVVEKIVLVTTASMQLVTESYLSLKGGGDFEYADPADYNISSKRPFAAMRNHSSSSSSGYASTDHGDVAQASWSVSPQAPSGQEPPRKRMAHVGSSPQRSEDDAVFDDYLLPLQCCEGGSGGFESMLESVWALIDPSEEDHGHASARTGSQVATNIITSISTSQPVPPTLGLSSVGRFLGSSDIPKCLDAMLQMFPYDCVDVWAPVQIHDKTVLAMGAYAFKEPKFQDWTTYSMQFVFELSAGVPGRVFTTHRLECIPDLNQSQVASFHRLDGAMVTGIRSTIALPVLSVDGTLMVFMLYSQHAFQPEEGMQRAMWDFLRTWRFDAPSSVKCASADADELEESPAVEQL
jgi:hypothetical protein